MGFHAPERTEAEAGQFFLQFADIVPADREIVDEVVGALTHRWCRGIEFGGEFLLRCKSGTAQFLDTLGSAVETQGSGDFTFGTALDGHYGLKFIADVIDWA